MTVHPIPPVFSASPENPSRILILGSFPSVRSRETEFFYGHPQNRFWKVMAAVLQEPTPLTVEEKKKMLISHGVALWDVIASCDIQGSADSSIKNAVPNDISQILAGDRVRAVFTNGNTATRLYGKYIQPTVGIPCRPLPSTSPANATWSLERLIGEWRVIREYL